MSVGGLYIGILNYADDFVFLACGFGQLRTMYQEFQDCVKDAGLMISLKPSKTTFVDTEPGSQEGPMELLDCRITRGHNQCLPVLGNILNTKNDMQVDIATRPNKMWASANRISSEIYNKRALFLSCIKLIRLVCFAAGTFGLESEALHPNILGALRSCSVDIALTALGKRRDPQLMGYGLWAGVWRSFCVIHMQTHGAWCKQVTISNQMQAREVSHNSSTCPPDARKITSSSNVSDLIEGK